MNLVSKAIKARPDTNSLRATIPEGIVFLLELQDGDTIEWIKTTIKGELAILVSKAKKD